MASKQIGGGVKIDSSVNVLTDVSAWIRSTSPSGDFQRLDATTLQPDVAAPVKTEIAGSRSRSLALTVLYTAASFTFFAAIEGLEGQDYALGPDGFTAGDMKISGLCNVLRVGLPAFGTDGIQEFPVELNCTTQVVGTW